MGSDASKLEGPDLGAGVAEDSLREGVPLLGHVDGEAAIVVRVGREVHAIGAKCTHYGGPLAEGLVVGTTVRCPWHHACFDVRSGEVLGGPALNALPCFDVRRVDGLVRRRAQRSRADAITKRHGDAFDAPEPIVIVGAGPAGAACAETLRAEGYAKTLVLVGAEAPGPVDRPEPLEGLPRRQRARRVDAAPRAASSTREQGIDFRLGDTRDRDRLARRRP